MVTLYILLSYNSQKKYVGITNNLCRRLKEHRALKTKAGEILGDFSVLHIEAFSDYKSAREREIFLKSGKGRAWINETFNKRACAP